MNLQRKLTAPKTKVRRSAGVPSVDYQMSSRQQANNNTKNKLPVTIMDFRKLDLRHFLCLNRLCKTIERHFLNVETSLTCSVLY